MQRLPLKARADLFAAAYPQFPDAWPVTSARWLTATWIPGNNYRAKRVGDAPPLYGAYPPDYVARVTAMFPDATATLHLFSGSLPEGPYVRFDGSLDRFLGAAYVTNGLGEIVPPSRLERVGGSIQGWSVGDANRLPNYFEPGTFDFVMADPPYTKADAARYKQPMPDRRKVLRGLYEIVRPGGYLVWLDCVLPQFRKDMWRWCGNVTIIRSTNHRERVANIFERTGATEALCDTYVDDRSPSLPFEDDHDAPADLCKMEGEAEHDG